MPIAADALFGRRARLQIGDIVFDDPFLVRADGRPAPLIGDSDALRLSFVIRKQLPVKTAASAAGSTKPTCELAIYNLAERTRRRLDQLAGTTARGIVLEAGYQEDVGVLFRGEVVGISSGREGTEWVTRVQATSGRALMKATVNESLAPGATKEARILALLATLERAAPGVSLDRARARLKKGDMPALLDELTSGVTMVGSALRQFEQLVRDLGKEAIVDDDDLSVLGPDEIRGDRVVVLTPFTGLISLPTRLPADTKRPDQVVVRARSLLQWRLGLGGMVEIGASNIAGMYRVRAVVHTGDTHDQEWSSEVEADEVARAYDPLLEREIQSQIEASPSGVQA